MKGRAVTPSRCETSHVFPMETIARRHEPVLVRLPALAARIPVSHEQVGLEALCRILRTVVQQRAKTVARALRKLVRKDHIRAGQNVQVRPLPTQSVVADRHCRVPRAEALQRVPAEGSHVPQQKLPRLRVVGDSIVEGTGRGGGQLQFGFSLRHQYRIPLILSRCMKHPFQGGLLDQERIDEQLPADVNRYHRGRASPGREPASARAMMDPWCAAAIPPAAEFHCGGCYDSSDRLLGAAIGMDPPHRASRRRES